MVTINKIKDKYNTCPLSLFGLSTDTKPTTTINDLKVVNGSEFTEIDTGKTFLFEEEGSSWKEYSGGGGGGGTSNYEDLENKPQINGVTLLGDKNTEDLKIERFLTQAEYDALPDSKLTDSVNYFISDGQSGTIRYNVVTDMIQIFDGTTWHNWKQGGLSGVDVNALPLTDWSFIGKANTAQITSYNNTVNPFYMATVCASSSVYSGGFRIKSKLLDLTGMNYLQIMGSCANIATNNSPSYKDVYSDTQIQLESEGGTTTLLKKFTVNGAINEIINLSGLDGKYKIVADCSAMPNTTGTLTFTTFKFTADNLG